MATERKLITITEAAKLNRVTRQAIYVAIKQNKLQAVKKAQWEIDINDLETYRKNRYSRTKSVWNGELVFNNDEGFFSIAQTARMLAVPAQKIYYATRRGYLKAIRKGVSWVIHINDINHYRDTFLPNQIG